AEIIVGDLLERCCRGSQATGPGRPRALGPWTGTSWAHPGCLPRSGGAPPGRVAWRRRRLAWCNRAEQTRPAGMLPWHIPGDRRGPANILLKNSSHPEDLAAAENIVGDLAEKLEP